MEKYINEEERKRVLDLRAENRVWALAHGMKPYENMSEKERRDEESALKAELIRLCRE